MASSFPTIAVWRRPSRKGGSMLPVEHLGVFSPSSADDSSALVAQVEPADSSTNTAAAIRLTLTPSTVLDDSSRQGISIIITVDNITVFNHQESSADNALPGFIRQIAKSELGDSGTQDVPKADIPNTLSSLELTLEKVPVVAMPRNIWPLAEDDSELSRVQALKSLSRATSVTLYFPRNVGTNSALRDFHSALRRCSDSGVGTVRIDATHRILEGQSNATWKRYSVFKTQDPAASQTVIVSKKRKMPSVADDPHEESKRVKEHNCLKNKTNAVPRVKTEQELHGGSSDRTGHQIPAAAASSTARALSPMSSMRLSRAEHDKEREARRILCSDSRDIDSYRPSASRRLHYRSLSPGGARWPRFGHDPNRSPHHDDNAGRLSRYPDRNDDGRGDRRSRNFNRSLSPYSMRAALHGTPAPAGTMSSNAPDHPGQQAVGATFRPDRTLDKATTLRIDGHKANGITDGVPSGRPNPQMSSAAPASARHQAPRAASTSGSATSVPPPVVTTASRPSALTSAITPAPAQAPAPAPAPVRAPAPSAAPGPGSRLSPDDLVLRWRVYHDSVLTNPNLDVNAMAAIQRDLGAGLRAARAGDEEVFKAKMADVFMQICERSDGGPRG